MRALLLLPVLKVVPGSSLAVVLDGFLFRYPIPLRLPTRSRSKTAARGRGR